MLHLITGNTSSGKTAFCNKLKPIPSIIIFSIDYWSNTVKNTEDGLDLFSEKMGIN